MQGQVSRARQALTGGAVAPRTLATLEELRRKRSQNQVQPIPPDVMEFIPETPVELNARVFATSLRSAPRGSAAGPGGCTFELLRVLMSAAEDFARAAVPRVVFKAFQQADMTALLKRDGGINVVPQVGGEESGEAVQQGSGTSMRIVPIRPFNESRHRLRGACETSAARRQSHCDRVDRGWHWSVRPRVPWRHAVQVALRTSSALPHPLRESHVFGTITLGGMILATSTTSCSVREGNRGSSDAPPLQSVGR